MILYIFSASLVLQTVSNILLDNEHVPQIINRILHRSNANHTQTAWGKWLECPVRIGRPGFDHLSGRSKDVKMVLIASLLSAQGCGDCITTVNNTNITGKPNGNAMI